MQKHNSTICYLQEAHFCLRDCVGKSQTPSFQMSALLMRQANAQQNGSRPSRHPWEGQRWRGHCPSDAAAGSHRRPSKLLLRFAPTRLPPSVHPEDHLSPVHAKEATPPRGVSIVRRTLPADPEITYERLDWGQSGSRLTHGPKCPLAQGWVPGNDPRPSIRGPPSDMCGG